MSLSHAALRESIQGQKVIIPSIYKLFPDWRPKLHPDYERARDEVLNPWIRRWVTDIRVQRALETADFGLFAAIWAESSSFEVLCTAAKYFAWYFIYDDIFDCGALKHDQGVLTNYKTASLQYFKFALLGEGGPPDLSEFDFELRNALSCWDEVGFHICQVCSKETREVLCEDMLLYVGSLNNVDSIFRIHDTPSIEEYWDRREATAAVHCVNATIPFIYGIDITRKDMQEPAMVDIRKHTSYFVHISNDMLSFRKEFEDGQIENLIPILMLNRGVDCGAAMQQSYFMLQGEADGFHEAKMQLTKNCEMRPEGVTSAFAQGCENVAMGLAHWSYSGDRYFKSWERDAHSAIKFVVRPSKAQPKTMGIAERFGLLKNAFILNLISLRHLGYTLLQFSPLIMWTIGALTPRLKGVSYLFSGK